MINMIYMMKKPALAGHLPKLGQASSPQKKSFELLAHRPSC